MVRLSNNYVTLTQLQTEQQRWGPLTAQLLAELKIKVNAEELGSEQLQRFLVSTIHAVALIGDYSLENEWEPEDIYNVCRDAIRELAQDAGFLPSSPP